MWQPCELLYTCYLLTYILTSPLVIVRVRRDVHHHITSHHITSHHTEETTDAGLDRPLYLRNMLSLKCFGFWTRNTCVYSVCFSNNLADMTGKFQAAVCTNAKRSLAVSCLDIILLVGGGNVQVLAPVEFAC